MRRYSIACLICVLLLGNAAKAQLPIPLDSLIQLQITSRDTDLLVAYNLYSFDYNAGGNIISAEFIVMKNEDSFSRKSSILAKLTLVKEFILFPAKPKAPPLIIPVESGIHVKNKRGLTNDTYLNFDPTMPDPVFLLGKATQEK